MTPEDEKLVALARVARGRIAAVQGAAVRDETGRSYAGVTIDLPSLRIDALAFAVASAFAAGARGFEAAVVVGPGTPDLTAVSDVGGPGIPVWHCDSKGEVIAELRS